MSNVICRKEGRELLRNEMGTDEQHNKANPYTFQGALKSRLKNKEKRKKLISYIESLLVFNLF